MSDYGELISKRMYQKGLTLKALSKLAGIKTNTLKNIIYGYNDNPNIGYIKKIAQVLGCRTKDLFPDEDNQPTFSSLEHNKLYKKTASLVSRLLRELKIEIIDHNIQRKLIEELFEHSEKKCSEYKIPLNVDKLYAMYLINQLPQTNVREIQLSD